MVQEPCILECIYISRDMASVSLCLYLSVLCHCLSLSLSLCCGIPLFNLSRPATCLGDQLITVIQHSLSCYTVTEQKYFEASTD